MTWKQWTLTAGLMLSVYLSGYIVQYSTGNWWYFLSASFSLLLIMALVRISLSTTTAIVVLLEFLALLVIFVSWGYYVNGVKYTQHEFLIYMISIMQLIVMIIGNPWFDLNSRISKQLGMVNFLHWVHSYRSKKHSHIHHKKT